MDIFGGKKIIPSKFTMQFMVQELESITIQPNLKLTEDCVEENNLRTHIVLVIQGITFFSSSSSNFAYILVWLAEDYHFVPNVLCPWPKFAYF